MLNKTLEARLDAIQRIQAERREQIVDVERRVAALQAIIAGHEIVMRELREQYREFRSEILRRTETIEVLLRAHMEHTAGRRSAIDSDSKPGEGVKR
jgi:hypothetical protein